MVYEKDGGASYGIPFLIKTVGGHMVLLRTEHISKTFNGIYALQDINFEISPGEVHGLVGENGAGKSTLIKILTGVYQLEEGKIFWEEKEVSIKNPVESREIGINVIHQDRTLVPSFNGIENAYLGREYEKKGGRIDWKAMESKVKAVAKELEIEIDLSLSADELSPPQKTCLEIIRAMMSDCKLMILDEPTASLTDKESEILFRIIETLKKKGTAILYITHRMDEIFRLTDRITIFKNGKMVDTLPTNNTSKDDLIGKMTDQWVSEAIIHKSTFGKPMLEVTNLSSKDGIVKSATLKVHTGEILGIFGLGGSGRTELLECIYGYRPMKDGTVVLDGQAYSNPNPSTSIESGMVLICEDRRGKAIIGGLSIKDNVLLSSMDSFSTAGVLNEKKEKAAVREKIEALAIKIAGMDQSIIELSGGNQQKVVFAKAMMTNPKVFLCDEPTQAVDVKTRNEIHKLLRKKADEGNAVLFVSSDLKEILEVSDNIQIVSRGYTKNLLKNENLVANEVLALCYED